MKHIRAITAASVLLLCNPTMLYAQGAGKEWNSLNQEVIQLYKQKEYDRAILVAQKALAVAINKVGREHPDTRALY